MIDNPIYEEDLSYINQVNIPWENLTGSSILITGGTGLIGSAIVDALIYRNEKMKAGITLWVISRNKKTVIERFGKYLKKDYFNFIQMDVCNEIQINSKIDYIIHGASKGDPLSFATDPVGVMNANYIGLYHVLELAREKKPKKVLYISSGEVHGRHNENVDSDIGLKEEDYGYLDILNQRASYASSKRASETLCVCYYNQYGINVNIARPCHIYGPAMLVTDSRVINEFIFRAKNHEDIIMKSDGRQKRSYCYVADTITALFTILLNGENGKAYNIANKDSIITVKELAILIAKIAHIDLKQVLPTEHESKGYSDITKAVLDSTKLEKLGWTAKYDIETGIRHVLQLI